MNFYNKEYIVSFNDRKRHDVRNIVLNEIRYNDICFINDNAAVKNHNFHYVARKKLKDKLQWQKISDLSKKKSSDMALFTYADTNIF